MLQLSEQQIQRCIQVNTVALHWTVQRLLPAMIKANKGHVVTIASLAGLVGSPGLMDYNASKFGAVGFNCALRAELNVLPLSIPSIETTQQSENHSDLSLLHRHGNVRRSQNEVRPTDPRAE